MKKEITFKEALLSLVEFVPFLVGFFILGVFVDRGDTIEYICGSFLNDVLFCIVACCIGFIGLYKGISDKLKNISG